MITLECASLKGLLDCASLYVKEGNISAIITETDFEKNLLIRVFTGLARLDSGSVLVFGKDLSSVTDTELNDMRKKIGVVQKNGGLVSNLKVWENLMLPVSYHTSLLYRDIEEKMLNVLKKVDYGDDLTALPGPLPNYKKRLAGFVRAMLMEPDIMIYDSVFDGLSPSGKDRVICTINEFHKGKKGRASLFLDLNNILLTEIKPDSVYFLKKGIFNERD